MRLSPRVRRALPLIALLILSVALLVVLGARLAQASLEMRALRQVQAGAVLGVRPWMTIPYIASTYGVPESDLFAALGLAPTRRNRHTPLRGLAAREGRDLDADIATLNATIAARRPPTPGPAPAPGGAPARTPGPRTGP